MHVRGGDAPWEPHAAKCGGFRCTGGECCQFKRKNVTPALIPTFRLRLRLSAMPPQLKYSL